MLRLLVEISGFSLTNDIGTEPVYCSVLAQTLLRSSDWFSDLNVNEQSPGKQLKAGRDQQNVTLVLDQRDGK